MGNKAHFFFWAVFLFLSGGSGASSVCAKTGDDVYLHLQKRDSPDLKDVTWKVNSETVASSKRIFKPSVEFFGTNGTLKIFNALTNWSGEFTAEVFNDKGESALERQYLVVLDPPVTQLTECSNGTSVFSCVNTNDSQVTYSWTVRKSELGEETAFSNRNQHKLLEITSGTVHCSVAKNGCTFHSKPLYFSCPKPQATQQHCSISAFISMPFLCLFAAGFALYIERCRKRSNLDMKSEVLQRLIDDNTDYSEAIYCMAGINK